MDTSLASLINIYTLSTGRRLFALAQTRKAAEERGFKSLAAHCETAIDHDRQTRALETRWAAPSAAQRRVVQTDLLVDRTLVAMRDAAQAHADAATEEDGDIVEKVATLLTAIFPKGVQAVTHLAFVDELSAVDGIVASLGSKELAPIVVELGIGRLAKQLATLAGQYRAELEAPARQSLSFGVVRAARAKGQEHVLQAVALILGKHHSSSAEDVAARGELLAPILKQNEAVRLYLRARRAVQDVHPETGEVDPATPAGEPAGEPKPA